MFPTPFFHDNTPTESLLKLLTLTGVSHDNTPTGIHAATQAAWRKPGLHQGKITEEHGHLREQAVPLLNELRMLGDSKPTLQQYDYVLVGGGFQMAIKKYFRDAMKWWTDGGRFQNNIVLLGGKRPRDLEKESYLKLNEDIEGLQLLKDHILGLKADTEDEIMEAILASIWGCPQEWNHRRKVVNTPLVPGRAKPDPTREETLRHWLEQYKPQTGSCILFAAQPAVMNAWLVAAKVLVTLGFTVEVVGYAAPTEPNISQVLDAAAKVIHELVT